MNYSKNEPEIWTDLGYGFNFNYNIQQENENYSYDSVFVNKKERNLLIQSLIHSKYSVDDEIALVNNYNAGLNVDKYNDYQLFRNECKKIVNNTIFD